MKKLVFILCMVAVPCKIFAGGYIFFLHNMFLELYGTGVAHPEYGKVEYDQVLNYFRKEGFTVMSELRGKNTDVKSYAAKIARQVDSLTARGVKPADITIVGTSKGGYIAQYVCSYLKNTQLSFVFIGSCSSDAKDGLPGLSYYGNILSIYEQSDDIGKPCKGIQNAKGSKIIKFKEIELNTGLKHGFLYKAMPEWLEPTVKWARHKYE